MGRLNLDLYHGLRPSEQTGALPVRGNAGETPADVMGGVQTYDYRCSLPVPFQVAAGTKCWVPSEAFQGGGAPD
jgi:hypothetical protein